MSKAVFKSLALASTLSLTTLLSFSSNATIVEVETSQGNFKINLHDQTTPKTVENFLNYVKDGDYNNTVVHRLIPNFVMQAGGFSLEGGFPLTPISIDASVINEPVYSSVQGTIAMAKPGNNPNGATSQWFINYKDNSSILDTQNGGFTVFGEVIEGMDNINAMAALLICREVPMPDYTAEQCADVNFVPGVENFVTINSITILDATVVTDANLSSVKNTLLSTTDSSGSSSGGGSLSYFALFSLALFSLRRKVKSA
ncbi:MAG: peptidylprolyl isomerase [Colwellia sp.]|nr:peptidylprolyl isomerase [Colwellia sp.]